MFLCASLLFFISNSFWKVMGVWAQNVQNSHQDDFEKIRHVKKVKSTQVHDK